jgi:predicted transcriptional regulator
MSLPEMTHLQVFVMNRLWDHPMTTTDIRESLAELGQERSQPGVCQLMVRMEEAGWVTKEPVRVMKRGQYYHESMYAYTQEGLDAFFEAGDFYKGLATKAG